MRSARLTLVIGWALLGAPSVVAAPPCVAQCETLLKTGELRKGVSEAGCEVRVCQQEARKLYEKNQFEQALESLEYLQPRLQDSPSYQLDRGLVYYALGRFEEAQKTLEESISGIPAWVEEGFQLDSASRIGHALYHVQHLGLVQQMGVSGKDLRIETTKKGLKWLELRAKTRLQRMLDSVREATEGLRKSSDFHYADPSLLASRISLRAAWSFIF